MTALDHTLASAANAPPDPPPQEGPPPLDQRAVTWINRLTFPRVLLALLVAAFGAGVAFTKAFVTRADLDQAIAPLRLHGDELAALRGQVHALELLEQAELEERREMRRQLYELAIKSGARVVVHLEDLELQPRPAPDAGVQPQQERPPPPRR